MGAFVLASPVCAAQEILPKDLAEWTFSGGRLASAPFAVSLVPTLELGTHRERIGLRAKAGAWAEEGAFAGGLELFASGRLALVDLGIPGAGALACAGIEGRVGAGEACAAASPWGDAVSRSLELRYAWMRYFDTWGTGQLGGRISLVAALGSASLGIAFHNDIFGLVARDEYRTAAVEIGGGFRFVGLPSSLVLGTRLWAGSTAGNGRLYDGQTYDLTKNLGWQNSAGILYLAARCGPFGLSAGWDSERLRDLFQNGIHKLIDDGRIPILDRDDRLFLEFTLFQDAELY
jgi:hypothetical protein